MLPFKWTVLAELLFSWILHTEITIFPLTSMLFSVTIRSEDVIPKMQETTGFFTVIGSAYEPPCLFQLGIVFRIHGQLFRQDHSQFNSKQEKDRERMGFRVTPELKEEL